MANGFGADLGTGLPSGSSIDCAVDLAASARIGGGIDNPDCFYVNADDKVVVRIRLQEDWAADDELQFWVGMIKNPANELIDIVLTMKYVEMNGRDYYPLH